MSFFTERELSDLATYQAAASGMGFRLRRPKFKSIAKAVKKGAKVTYKGAKAGVKTGLKAQAMASKLSKIPGIDVAASFVPGGSAALVAIRATDKYKGQLNKIAISNPLVAKSVAAVAKYGKPLAGVLNAGRKKIFGQLLSTLTTRRANYLAFQRRNEPVADASEKREGQDWAKKYLQARGGVFGKMAVSASVVSGDDEQAVTLGGVLSIPVPIWYLFLPGAAYVAYKYLSRAAIRKSMTDAVLGGGIGAAANKASAVYATVPALIVMAKKIIASAEKEGAPSDPQAAAPPEDAVEERASEVIDEEARETEDEFEPPGVEAQD